MFTQGQKSCHNIVLPFVNMCSVQIFHLAAVMDFCESIAAFGVFNQGLLTMCLVFDLLFENNKRQYNDTVMHHPDVAHTCCLPPCLFKIAVLPSKSDSLIDRMTI